MEVIKRNGKLVPYEPMKIQVAVLQACREAMLDSDSATELATQVIYRVNEQIPVTLDDAIHVDAIQLLVGNALRERNKEVFSLYKTYRLRRALTRPIRDDSEKLLTDEFISKFKHLPSPMTALGDFVYYRTYSRWLPVEKRREFWWETVRRAVEYNCSLAPTSRGEAERLFENVYFLKQFLSGRTFWVGGTPVADKFPMANYNCAFSVLDSIKKLVDLLYILLIGTGAGIRVRKEDTDKLPKFRTDLVIKSTEYQYSPDSNLELSEYCINGDTLNLKVGDSKEGWVTAFEIYLNVLTNPMFSQVKAIEFDFNAVRPKGAKLKTFGGTASGHESLKDMFERITKLISQKDGDRVKLEPIDVSGIANLIGVNVVVGGVRRTAEMIIFDAQDSAMFTAKSDLYKMIDGEWVLDKDIDYRQMSNNSVGYEKKPTREEFSKHMKIMRKSGEPAWVNYELGRKRKKNFQGVNPCGEILLDDRGLCNLTTLNVFAFVKPDGTLDVEGLMEAQTLSARAGLRMTTKELELPEWDDVQNAQRLLGLSLTGWQDTVNAVGLTKDEEAIILRQLREVARNEADKYAKYLGINCPELVTTIKPEGTLSQLPTVSSGVHYSHAPYYIRRVRVNAHDPLVYACEELGWVVKPEVGQGSLEECSTKVVEFPVKSPEGLTKYDVTAIEQLENYKLFMDNYVDHNCSITVHVRDHEWEEVEEWIWENWDSVVAVSFLSLTDNFYDLLPYEAITKEEYTRRKEEMLAFSASLLAEFEQYETLRDADLGKGCESGSCPVR